MASFNKFNAFVENGVEVINLGTDQLKIALTNTQPLATNSVLADITEITYTYCSSRNVTTSSSSQTGGTYKLVCADLDLTATGGSVGPFRWVILYSDTPTSPADPLIAWWEYGASSITLADGEKLTIDFDQTNGILQLT